jgi:RNA polymerase sigma factor (sigma-70 family)
MAAGQMSEVIQHLRSAVLLRDRAGLTDGQLLEGFLSRRDEAALAALVLRHAPMVWGVCRRVLRNAHDAEDAFQATFLVLVRKAASIASRELLANWLYGVAYQTARKARATAARRGARERQVQQMPEPAVGPPGPQHDLQALLDQELSRLPDKYRVAILLCDLEGKTRQEAAREIGCPEGTVAGRLARARGMLAKRLARHGVVLSGGSLAAALVQEATSACVPTAVVSSTINAASLFAAGPAAASAAVAALTEGVLKSMLLTKLKTAVAVLLAVLVLGAGLGTAGLLYVAPSPKPAPDRAGEKDAKVALGALQGDWRVFKLDVEHEETRELFEKLGKVVIKGDKATLMLDLALAGKGEKKEAITWAEFTILKVGTGKSPATIDLRLDKAIEVQGLKPKTGATLPGIYSLKGDTLKLFLDEEARPKAFPDKEKQGVVTLKRVGRAGKKGAPKPKPQGKVEPPGAPLAAVLKANKDTYKLDLGGRSAEQFRKVAKARDRFDAGGPLPPAVDLVLEVRNTSDKEVQFFTLPDLAEVKLGLKGPDTLTVQMQGPFQLDRRLPPPIRLAPGKVFTRPIRSLNHGHRDIEFRSYWLAPGDYTLTARFHTAMLPAPAGAVLYDGRLGEPQLRGFGVVTVTTPPLKLKVVR